MGYTTDFVGAFELDKPMTEAQAEYLKHFNETRRMKRDPKIAELMDDPVRIAAGLPIGKDAEYFTGGLGFAGQERDDSVVENNSPGGDQPSLWCQWIATKDRRGIEWDGNEKFYEYVEWLRYIIEHFLKPWGYTLNGSVKWFGEENTDIGIIEVTNNDVHARQTTITY